jgi:hypothetical protein
MLVMPMDAKELKVRMVSGGVPQANTMGARVEVSVETR